VTEMLYEVRYLKSSEDMILALAGQFKHLSQEPEKFRTLKPICSSTKQNNAAPSIYYPCQSRGGREGWGLANLVRPWGRAIAKLGSPSDLCCPLHKHPLFWNECPMFNQPDLTGQTYSQLNLRSKSLEYRIFQKCESKFMWTT